MEQLGKVISQVTKFVQGRVPSPLGEQIHEFTPGDQIWVKGWKHDSLAPRWKGPYTVILTTPAAVNVAGIAPWIHDMRVKRAYHTDPENAEWTVQRDPTDPRETKIILKKKKGRVSQMTLFRMKPHNQLLLLGLINMILNLTSISTQDYVFISWAHSSADFHNTYNCWVCGAMPLSVMDGLPWWVSPLCQGYFKLLCSFLGRQKETFLSLVNHNLSFLFWCKLDLQSIDLGHGVTFDINASVTKA